MKDLLKDLIADFTLVWRLHKRPREVGDVGFSPSRDVEMSAEIRKRCLEKREKDKS